MEPNGGNDEEMESQSICGFSSANFRSSANIDLGARSDNIGGSGSDNDNNSGDNDNSGNTIRSHRNSRSNIMQPL